MTNLSVQSASPVKNTSEYLVEKQRINALSLDDAVGKISAEMATRKGFAVFTINLDHVVKLRQSADFRAAYTKARFVLADGQPIVWLGRLKGVAVERTTGSDLIIPLCRQAARQGQSIYLLGATQEALAGAAQRLRQEAPGLDICEQYAPAGNFDPAGPEADACIERIRQSGADLCFVALGAPKQELFAARAVSAGVGAGFLCIGAGLDFLAGTQHRAPLFFQKYAIEWVWRLVHQPRRLAGRYARSAVAFASLLIEHIRQLPQPSAKPGIR
jgi:N-acetylglucosaminyldiphosphoundecaprenol N-acetyl-beta-D-mannosaminyltransferase